MYGIRKAVDKRLNDIKFVGHAAATVASSSRKPRRYKYLDALEPCNFSVPCGHTCAHKYYYIPRAEV